VAALAGRLGIVSDSDREQRLVFGEIAQQYEAFRPSYPHELFDTIIDFGDLHAGHRALEIGAGTGKATVAFVARGLDVHALEPSPGMAAVLRGKGIEAEETLFEEWDPGASGGFQLVYAAQAWHWVRGDDRYDRVAAALRPGGTVAFFWNKGRDWTGSLGADNDAAYARLAPEMSNAQWQLDWVADGIDACALLGPPTRRIVTWTQPYSRVEWERLLGTHSDHRILPDEQRARLHTAVGDVIDRHGGHVEVVYDVEIFLSRRFG
jgi:SAM-dependent methyltransferase